VAPSPLIVLFARWPRLGRVKTRLAAELGEAAALAIHRAMLEDTLARLERIRGEGWAESSVLWADDPMAGQDLLEHLGRHPDQALQEGSDLGERLARAIEEALGEGRRAVVIIGSDSPTLPDLRLREALEALAAADLVYGPCPDGGYYLVGARRPVPEAFGGVPWGGGEVLERSLAGARAAGASTLLLATHADVDRPGDLIGLRKQLAAEGGEAARLAPRTRAVLEELS
jgi:rSAM/selenodomain-associated transferase 1